MPQPVHTLLRPPTLCYAPPRSSPHSGHAPPTLCYTPPRSSPHSGHATPTLGYAQPDPARIPLRPSRTQITQIRPAHTPDTSRPHSSYAPPTRASGLPFLPPHRGSCQNENGFLPRQRYVGVRLHQGLHSRQRQPRQTRPWRTRRSLRLQARRLPTEALFLPGRPARRRRGRHPGPSVLLVAARRCARSRAGPFPARAAGHAPVGAGHAPRVGAGRAGPLFPGSGPHWPGAPVDSRGVMPPLPATSETLFVH